VSSLTTLHTFEKIFKHHHSSSTHPLYILYTKYNWPLETVETLWLNAIEQVTEKTTLKEFGKILLDTSTYFEWKHPTQRWGELYGVLYTMEIFVMKPHNIHLQVNPKNHLLTEKAHKYTKESEKKEKNNNSEPTILAIKETYKSSISREVKRSAYTTKTPNKAATFTSPLNGSTLTSKRVTFRWSGAKHAKSYKLYVNNIPIYSNSGTSVTYYTMPTHGDIHVKLITYFKDGKSETKNYNYTTPNRAATLTNPTNGSTLTSNHGVTFKWSGANNASCYRLYINNALVYAKQGTEVVYTNLPNSGNVNVRLVTYFRDGKVASKYYSYKTQSQANKIGMATPTNKSTIDTSKTTTFRWYAPHGSNFFRLYLGTYKGGENLGYGYVGNKTYYAKKINQNSGTLHVKLHGYNKAQKKYETHYYTYTIQSSKNEAATLTSPTNGATLTNNRATFRWNGANNAKNYKLYVNNRLIYSNSGTVVTYNSVPTSGTVNVRLITYFKDGKSETKNYNYTTPNQVATLSSPANGTTLTSNSVTFRWKGANNAKSYKLYVNNKLIYSNSGTAVTYNSVPTSGDIDVKLITYFQDGKSETKNYNYTTPNQVATLTSPANGTTLTSKSVTFRWSGANNAKSYRLDVNNKLIYSNSGTVITYNSVPTNSTVNVRLTTYFKDGKSETKYYTYIQVNIAKLKAWGENWAVANPEAKLTTTLNNSNGDNQRFIEAYRQKLGHTQKIEISLKSAIEKLMVLQNMKKRNQHIIHSLIEEITTLLQHTKGYEGQLSHIKNQLKTLNLYIDQSNTVTNLTQHLTTLRDDIAKAWGETWGKNNLEANLTLNGCYCFAKAGAFSETENQRLLNQNLDNERFIEAYRNAIGTTKSLKVAMTSAIEQITLTNQTAKEWGEQWAETNPEAILSMSGCYCFAKVGAFSKAVNQHILTTGKDNEKFIQAYQNDLGDTKGMRIAFKKALKILATIRMNETYVDKYVKEIETLLAKPKSDTQQLQSLKVVLHNVKLYNDIGQTLWDVANQIAQLEAQREQKIKTDANIWAEEWVKTNTDANITTSGCYYFAKEGAFSQIVNQNILDASKDNERFIQAYQNEMGYSKGMKNALQKASERLKVIKATQEVINAYIGEVNTLLKVPKSYKEQLQNLQRELENFKPYHNLSQSLWHIANQLTQLEDSIQKEIIADATVWAEAWVKNNPNAKVNSNACYHFAKAGAFSKPMNQKILNATKDNQRLIEEYIQTMGTTKGVERVKELVTKLMKEKRDTLPTNCLCKCYTSR
jgi:post-segregation antitoxin (ccd killing protein)